MERKVTFSACNQYRFIPLDEVLPEKYNFRQFDKALFSEVQEYYMTKSEYAQKIQKSDPCRIQMKTTQNFFPVRLYVYKCGGELVSGPFALSNFALSPALIEQGIERFVQRYENPTFFNNLEGNYYLVLECRFDENNDGVVDFTDWFVSEPISVKAKHPKTGLLEVGNSTNKDDVIFKQPRQKFSLRVESMMVPMQPKSDRVVFMDQGEQPVQISATASRSWTLIFLRVPMWMVDKLNHYFALDAIYYEGLGITPIDGAALKYDVQETSYGLCQVSIEVAESDGQGVFEYFKGGIEMFQVPDFPFVIYSTDIGHLNNYDFNYPQPIRIADDTALNNWINARNASITASGMAGQIARSTTTVVYNRGLGENYTYAKSRILTRRLGIVNTTTGVQAVPLSLEMSGGSYTGLWVVFNPALGYAGTGNAPQGEANFVISNFAFNAPGAGTYTYELWHEGTIEKIYMKGARISGIDKYGLETSLPPLTSFGIDDSVALTAFSLFGQLPELRNTLVNYRLRNNANLTDTGVYYPLLAYSTHGWKKLQTVTLNQNRLNAAMIDQWFNSMRAATLAPDPGGFGPQFYIYNGSVLINNQSPAAAPTSASSAARNILMNTWGWNLTY